MKRYWLANSSDTPPSPPSSTVGGYPQDGNIALNHKPTKVGAWWYHMITEEFMAVIERAGLTPSHENLHQLADIFDDFKQRAQGAETFKDQAVAAANRAEAAAGQVVTDVAGAIAQVQAATDAEIARLNTRAGEVETSTSTGLTNLQNKLTELIANLEQVGGEQAAYVISQAQEILDELIPPQSGQAGKFLSTDGESTEWKALDALPLQTGNNGKFLTTNGTTASWQPVPSRNIGEIIQSAIPLTDAGLHLLDGSLLPSGGVYAQFVQHINGLQSSYPSLFCTQAEFDLSVSKYGVCSKFVSSASGIRLPKLYSETRYLVKAWKSGTEWYNLYSDGWCEQGGVAKYTQATNPIQLNVEFADINYSVTLGTFNTATGANDRIISKDTSKFDWYSCAASTTAKSDWTAVGYAKETPDSEKIYRYICVATAVKEPTEVVIDNIITDNNNKADKDFANVTKPYVVEIGENSAGWWKIYSNGWCEQGGKATVVNASSVGVTVPLPIEMQTKDYFIYAQPFADNMNTTAISVKIVPERSTPTSFNYLFVYASGGSSGYGGVGAIAHWKVEGWKK